MKLLIDSCVAGAVARRLGDDGHDVRSVAAGGADPGDQAILQSAVAEERVIVTIDADFGVLVFRDQAQRVGVLRLREARPAAMAERAAALIEAHGEALSNGAFVTDDGDRARVTR